MFTIQTFYRHYGQKKATIIGSQQIVYVGQYMEGTGAILRYKVFSIIQLCYVIVRHESHISK